LKLDHRVITQETSLTKRPTTIFCNIWLWHKCWCARQDWFCAFMHHWS